MTDYRALCSELVKLLEVSEEWSGCTQPQALTRARAALAQPEPVAPTIDDISELCEEFEFHLDGNGEYNDDLESAEALWEICRAVLARWGQP